MVNRQVISSGNLKILLYCLCDSLGEATKRSRQCCSGSKENRLSSHVLQNPASFELAGKSLRVGRVRMKQGENEVG